MTNISDYFHESLILFLSATERDRAIDELIDRLVEVGTLPEPAPFRDAVLKREAVVSTGIGMGVAVPHAKLSGLKDFFVAVGIQSSGILWDALDGLPVKLVFLIGGPDDKRTEYLQLLSSLTLAIRESSRRKQILHAKEPCEVLSLLKKDGPAHTP